MLDQRLGGVGVDPRVDRLVADRVAVGMGRIAHRSHCATCLHAQACANLAGRAPLRQISNHAVAYNLIAVQEQLPWGGAPWKHSKPRTRQVSDALRVYGMLAASADKGGVRVLPDWA